MPQLFSFSFHTSFIPSWRNISTAVKQTPRAQGTVLLCSKPTVFQNTNHSNWFSLLYSVSQSFHTHLKPLILRHLYFLQFSWPPPPFLNCKIPSTYSHLNLNFPILMLLSDGNQNWLTENKTDVSPGGRQQLNEQAQHFWDFLTHCIVVESEATHIWREESSLLLWKCQLHYIYIQSCCQPCGTSQPIPDHVKKIMHIHKNSTQVLSIGDWWGGSKYIYLICTFITMD